MGALDRPSRFLAELAQLDISDYARRLIRQRAWAHMLGFCGHFSTKSRATPPSASSATPVPIGPVHKLSQGTRSIPNMTFVLMHWGYAGTDLTDAEAWLAETLEPAPGTEGGLTNE